MNKMETGLEPIITDEQGTVLASVELVQTPINCCYFPEHCDGSKNPEDRAKYCEEAGNERDCSRYQALKGMHSAFRTARIIGEGR